MTPIRTVLALPPCMICSDRAAGWEVETPWRAALAQVCEECLPAIPGTAVAILVEAAAEAPLFTPELAGAYLASQDWVYAKTMPKWPHEYVLMRRSTDMWGHLRTVEFIRRTGEQRPWHRRLHSYWQPGDGREYWTMRAFDTILNRRRIEDE